MADDATTTPAGPAGGGRGLAPGQVFAGHEIVEEAGRGAMGTVYAARHLRLHVTRALKVLSEDAARDPTFRARFELESRLAAGLEHPNIVPVYEAGESEGRLYIAMRFVDGPSLGEVLSAAAPLTLARVSQLAAQLGAALDAAHAHGLVHRDVKPANVMLEGAAAQERAFLGDFGISRLVSGSRPLTETGEMLGTVDYVAPEQIAGAPVDGRADVYSLACLVFEALTGAPPFRRQTRLATLFAHANDPRPRASERRAELPRAADGVLVRALAIEPGQRYGSAGEFAEDLTTALSGGRVRGVRRAHGPRVRWIAALAGLVAAAAAVALLVGDGGSEQPGGGEAGIAAPPAEAVASVEVIPEPSAITIGELNVWVASEAARSIAAIVPATNASARPELSVEAAPASVAAAFGSIWLVDRQGDSLLRLDPGEGTVPTAIPVGRRPSDVALSAGHLWVTNEAEGTVSRVDPQTNRVDATIEVGERPVSLAIGEGGVWVANAADRTIVELDPASGEQRGGPIPLEMTPTEVAAGEAGVWVVDGVDGRIARIGPGSRELTDEIDTGGSAQAVAAGLGYAWVAHADGAVTRIDPTELAAAGDPIPVGADPAAIAIGKGFVWTADRGDGTVTRIEPRAPTG